jgi:hypothetical protein
MSLFAVRCSLFAVRCSHGEAPVAGIGTTRWTPATCRSSSRSNVTRARRTSSHRSTPRAHTPTTMFRGLLVLGALLLPLAAADLQAQNHALLTGAKVRRRGLRASLKPTGAPHERPVHPPQANPHEHFKGWVQAHQRGYANDVKVRLHEGHPPASPGAAARSPAPACRAGVCPPIRRLAREPGVRAGVQRQAHVTLGEHLVPAIGPSCPPAPLHPADRRRRPRPTPPSPPRSSA